MNILRGIEVNSTEYARFVNDYNFSILSRDHPLVYKNQSLNVAAIVADGIILIENGINKKLIIQKPTFVGIKELVENQNFLVNVLIKSKSKIILFDRIVCQRYFGDSLSEF